MKTVQIYSLFPCAGIDFGSMLKQTWSNWPQAGRKNRFKKAQLHLHEFEDGCWSKDLSDGLCKTTSIVL